MAEELGQARLVLTLDDGPLRKGLQDAKRLIEQELGGATASATPRRAAGSSRRGGTSTGGGGQDFNELNEVARRFNLRSVIRALEELNNEFQQIQAGRQLNIGTSWGVALNTLTEISNDLQRLSAGSQLNLNASWTAALNQLSEIDADLRLVAAGKELNLNSSWNRALNQLTEIDTDLRVVAAGEKLNLDASWNTALKQLSEIQTDLTQIAAGEKLNLNSSWNTALKQLTEIDADLRLVAAGEKLNLNSSWNAALAQLSDIDADLRLVAAGEKLNLNTSWNAALRQLAEIDTDLRTIAAGRRLNLDASWNTALRQLTEIDTDLRTIASGRRLNLRASWNKFFEDAEQVRRDIRASGEAARKRSRLDTQKRIQDVASNAVIGGAFPLLFGQGIGASIGGAAGGAGGGALGGQFGFGLSLVGTAVGAAFDTAITKAQELAKALDAPIENFDTLKNSALLSSKALEKQVEALIATGRTAEAAALIQDDLANSYLGIERARELAAANDELSRAWSRVGVSIADLGIEGIASQVGNLAESLRGFSNVIDALKKLVPQGLPRLPQGQETGSAFFNPLSGGFGVAALLELGKAFAGPKPQDQTKELERQQQLELKLASARAQSASALSNSYKLITASVQQNRAALQTAKEQEVIEQRNTKLLDLRARTGVTAATDPRVIEINQEAARKLFELKEQQLQTDRDISAQTQLQSVSAALQLGTIRERLANTKALAATEQGIARDTLRNIQAIQGGIAESQRAEQNIGAQIGAARIRGAEPEEIAKLVQDQTIAAEETKARLVEGAQALKEAGESLRDNFRDAVLNLTKVRSDPSGLNRFLSPGARARRAEQDTNRLLPFFRVAERQFFERTGEKAPPSAFRGSPEAVNQAIRDFIQAVNAEREAELAVQNAQAAINLVKTNQDLINANVTLAQVTQLLVDKDWTVNVFPPSAGRPADPVNAINGLS